MKVLWKNHGTKILGGVGAAASGLALLDPSIITVVLNAVLGDRGPAAAALVLSLLTMWRGRKNTQAQQTEVKP